MTRRRSAAAPLAQPDLIPVMNLVCLLIPFLLLTATFVQYAAVQATAPRANPMAPDTTRGDPPMNLSVLVTDLGFTVTAHGRILGDSGAPVDASSGSAPTIGLSARGAGGHDMNALTSLLREIKQEHRSESQIYIGAERNVDYETIIQVMDASREDDQGELFPQVTLLAGVL